MQNYNIFRVFNSSIEQANSFRPGLNAKHAIEVATGEAMQYDHTLHLDNGDFEVFTDAHNRYFMAQVIR